MGRWTEADMDTFLEVYQEHEELWNPKLELYRNNGARKRALSDIIKRMNKPNLTVSDMKIKIKNIRTTYKRELTKILKAKKSGNGTDDCYEPVLIWFKKADTFLRNVTEARGSKINMDVFVDASGERQEMQDEFSTDPSSIADEETEFKAAIVTSTKRIDFTNRKRKLTEDVSANVSSLHTSLGTLDGISLQSNTDAYEEECSLFGKLIAVQLSQLPLCNALVCQEKIAVIIRQERIQLLHSQGSNSKTAKQPFSATNSSDEIE
ncbi:hypothetical protein ABEB36_007059 [Hypothenemus hampei]|uniref:MADF domain-containing protein n=1 Tax=Hypothenemus hampei TaxID=57062 RepID=A0ABD1EWL7_HYPHA